MNGAVLAVLQRRSAIGVLLALEYVALSVPPQNPVDGTIVDVSALGVRLANPMVHLLYALLATARSTLTP